MNQANNNILTAINAASESIMLYLRKLIEIESALVSFNLNLVNEKNNEIEVVNVGLKKAIENIKVCFTKNTGIPYSVENLKAYLATDFAAGVAYENLMGYYTAVAKQKKDLKQLADDANEFTFKQFGQNISNFNDKKEGKWARRSKR